MAASEAAAPPNINQMPSNAPPTTPARPVTKSSVTREHDLTIRAFFPLPQTPTIRAFFPLPQTPMKFNPITAMTQLLRIMLKEEPSLVLRTANNDKQLILASDSLPTGEKAFKQFFTVSTPRAERQKTQHVCIGCNLLSDRTLGNIKFRSPESSQLLTWLKKAKVFLESDSLGTDRPVTIGYLTKIDPVITHLAKLQEYLANQLSLIEIDVDTALGLAPHLKKVQLEAMSNGDEFVTILPPFELYKTRLTHGRDPSQISTEVIGIKGAPKDVKLLGEFFTRLASEVTNDTRDGVFLPSGAVHLIGPAIYAQVLQENNFFLNNVATVPVNLEYAAWFAVIDANNHSDDAPVSLHDHLLRKSWFLRLESVSRNKCLIVTTKSNLLEARKWIDDNLESLIRKSIPQGLEPPSSLLPRRLDKPVYSKTAQTYADILKKQFSLETNTQSQQNTNNRPPRKRPAKLLDYDSDQSIEYPPLVSNNPTKSNSNPTTVTITQQHTATASLGSATDLSELKHEISQLKEIITTAVPAPATTVDYAAELQLIKTELATLRKLIDSAVEQMTSVVTSLQPNTPAPAREMDIDDDHSTDSSKTPTPELSDLITELKNEIATMATEMRTTFQELRAPVQQIPFEFTPFPT